MTTTLPIGTQTGTLTLPIRVEEWTDEHRAAVAAAVRAAGLGGRVWVVGSYAFGRPDGDPPSDLDLVAEGPGLSRSAMAADRAPFPVRQAVLAALSPLAGGRHVDLFCTDALRTHDDDGRPVPHYDVEAGHLLGRAPGEPFAGTYHVGRGGAFRWIPEKPPRPCYPFTTAADLVRQRHSPPAP